MDQVARHTPHPFKRLPATTSNLVTETTEGNYSFVSLPADLVIAILCEGLEPRDLIAVSHVRNMQIPLQLLINEDRVAMCMASSN
ncbi:hypothetical protein DL93DRAFT_2082203 [Clavulina sp. PMI_390]|nr:hypothetical protein DL93DRAFT_2082203 [Clavulina sp. PMI_390]